jgi:hypothetical protein
MHFPEKSVLLIRKRYSGWNNYTGCYGINNNNIKKNNNNNNNNNNKFNHQ